MVVQHNISAMTANRYYTNNNSALGKSMEKLSSGLAINRAGDNAAGLAVSEKMRAQIAGLSQASKNAQDGISMVQTFEGALQETDSILQRMRTLAVQSANGSYANEVDRDAIQLEFDQLNDELNQIADTDYNGVVVLNGGEMADGVSADDTGKIDYRAAVRNANSDAEAISNSKHFCDDADAGTNVVDYSGYGKEQADAIWDALGQTATSTDKDNPDQLDITFTYDGSEWKASAVTDKDGNTVEVSDEQLAKITAVSQNGGNGGFKISADGTDTTLNAVFDTSNAKKYDTATIKVTNLAGAKDAPDNVGIAEDGYSVNESLSAAGFTAPTIAGFEAGVFTDDKMNDERVALLDTLKDTEFTIKYAANGKTGALDGWTDVDVNKDGTKIGTLKAAISGGVMSLTFQKDSTNNAGSTLDTGSGVVFAKININDTSSNVLGTAGELKFKLNTDSYEYTAVDGLTAKSVATVPENAKPTADSARDGVVARSNALGNGERNLTYAQSMSLQTGARSKDLVEFTFKYDSDAMGDLTANMNCSAREGGLGTEKLSLKTQESANAAIDKIDNAINKVSMVRATFGAIQNRLEHKISNLDTNAENITAAESRIRDTQMDQEMMKFTSAQILSQASQSMLAQANSLPQGVLQLLG